jgi:phosphate transport system protein
MERRLDQALEEMRQLLLRMGAEVEEMVTGSVQALIDRDTERSEAIIEQDTEIDQLQIDIDKMGETIMATQQPTAIDMRFLVAVMKINTDLERIGDLASNICKSVRILNEMPPLKPYVDLPRMTQFVRDMVHGALDAFLEKDSTLAVDVCVSDDKVDAMYEQLFRELLTYMIEDPKNVSRGLQLLFICRDLERVADHATNIAEDVIFYVEGKDVRHLQPQEQPPAD